jgi:alginate O-acetyltransferase complex protein AlgI
VLFNSPEFLFVFLPLAVAGFFVASRVAGAGTAAVWLSLASLAFYGWSDPKTVLPIIVASMIFNFAIGGLLARSKNRKLLWFGIAVNLLYLGYFKYSAFTVASLNDLAHLHLPIPQIGLPLGISFFTFTQTAFIVDAYRREVSEYKPVQYCLFVTFFPHLVAGPIIHHKEIMPQFADEKIYRFDLAAFTMGLSWFCLGLAKKVLLADNVGLFATKFFASVHAAEPVGFIDAWLGSTAYALQIYFDFSGYSDMAIGLALMFGIVLPLNFDSPYKSASLIEFWRRWHMTLSRFLRDYLYIPLGGRRRGPIRRYANLLICMVLGGLWHGAAWNFVAWGAMHGAGLAVNHVWRDLAGRRGIALPRHLGLGLTLLFVIVAWVPFRAETISDAFQVWRAMVGRSVADAAVLDATVVPWVLALLLISLFVPNTQQIMTGAPGVARWLRWRPSPLWAAVTGSSLGAVSVSLYSGRVSEFLYFRF